MKYWRRKMKNKHAVSIYLEDDPELYDEIVYMAIDQKRSVSQTCKLILKSALELQIKARKGIRVN
jgi:hypothetical protein